MTGERALLYSLFIVNLGVAGRTIIPGHMDSVIGVYYNRCFVRIAGSVGQPLLCPGRSSICAPLVKDFRIPRGEIIPDHMDSVVGVY